MYIYIYVVYDCTASSKPDQELRLESGYEVQRRPKQSHAFGPEEPEGGAPGLKEGAPGKYCSLHRAASQSYF